jgi:acetylornithine deacetylase/succinyl-diaminopimelate desuccinylase-like protein
MRYKNSLSILKDFVRLPSVSAQGPKAKPIIQSANFVKHLFKNAGFNVLSDTIKDNSIIYAEYPVYPTKPTLLFYNHYDVQPPDPLDEWMTAPFSPTIRQGKLFGRGVADNKGDLIARFSAVKSLIDKHNLSVNIKFLIDGAEEIGSPGLSDFIHKYRSKLSADLCIWEFGRRNKEGCPELSLGVKGILYLELATCGANQDLHSSRGIIIPNPAWRLIWALSSLKNEHEQILIKGFYANCLKPTRTEMDILRPILLDEKATKQETGIKKFLLDLSGRALRKRYFYEPALNINGLTSGYQGKGHKTILPKQASAKIDFRLVPDQKPDDIIKKLRRHLDKQGFSDVKIMSSHGYPPAKTSIKSAVVKKYLALFNNASRKVFGKEFITEPLSPASGPMYLFTDWLKIPCFSLGIAHHGSNIHAPNENIFLSDYHKCIRFIKHII